MSASVPPRSSFLPYPELVETRGRRSPWKIEDSNANEWLPSNGVTDMRARRVFVPLEAAGRGVSIHELAHIRWSPERLPRVRYPLILLQAVEDARINLGLASIGLTVTLDREQRAHVAHLAARDAKSGDVASTLVRAIASLGTEAEGAMREEVDALPPRAAALAGDWLVRVEERLRKASGRVGEPVAPFRVGSRIARELARDLARNGLLEKNMTVVGLGCCHAIEEEDESSWSKSRSRYWRYLRRLRHSEHDTGGGKSGGAGRAVGRMSIARPPLTVRQPSVLRAGMARRRCATEGAMIARPDRLLLDRAIFAARGRGGGGTILIDTSGSMHLGADALEKIVRSAGGAAVVAIYSGKGDRGELRIVARGDRRVTSDELRPFGSGNVVDLPALDWLAKQPGPRCWISDGCVTGVDDQGCEVVLEKCNAIVARGGIERFADADEAIEALKAKSFR